MESGLESCEVHSMGGEVTLGRPLFIAVDETRKLKKKFVFDPRPVI
jgi:hypothetical protein